jgi:hypothetical protein
MNNRDYMGYRTIIFCQPNISLTTYMNEINYQMSHYGDHWVLLLAAIRL